MKTENEIRKEINDEISHIHGIVSEITIMEKHLFVDVQSKKDNSLTSVVIEAMERMGYKLYTISNKKGRVNVMFHKGVTQ